MEERVEEGEAKEKIKQDQGKAVRQRIHLSASRGYVSANGATEMSVS